MALDDIASRALENAKSVNEFKHHYRKLTTMRQIGNPSGYKASKCPACGQGLKKKVAPGQMETILLCPGCNWFAKIPFAMDEAVDVHESYIPGVTKQRTPTVVMDSTGKIKKVLP